jgi:hypothetical protein
MEPGETAIPGQRLGKYVPAATNIHVTIEELKSYIFWDIMACSLLKVD